MKRNKDDEQALEGSISYWKRRSKTGRLELCPLCTLSKKRSKNGKTNCTSCIISKLTGRPDCIDTPFWEEDENNPNYRENEIAFLKSLRLKKGK